MSDRLRAARRLLLCVALAGCTQETPWEAEAPQILAIGDSILAWNRASGRAIADEVERLTGREVVDRAVIGARLLPAFSIVGLLKGPVDTQYVAGDWDWVIVSAGGNDLWWGCGCTRCEERLNDLISEDGQRGAAPDLAASLRDNGAQVIWLGYPSVVGRWTPVEQCGAIGARFEARLARMAARDTGTVFISNPDFGQAGGPSLMAPDRIHPSPQGSAEIARRIVAILRARME